MVNSNFFDDNFIAFAHRGGNDYGPENSLKAFKGAYESGYKYLETDIHLSKDGHLLAFHDDSIDRVTNNKGKIKNLNLSEIKKSKIDGKEEIPVITDLFEELPNCFFSIDCKSDDTVLPLIKIIKDKSLMERICIGSFSQKRINLIRNVLGPNLKTSMGPNEIILSKLLSNFSINYKFKSNFASLPIEKYGLELLNEKNIKYLQKNNQKVIAWTINDENDMRLLIRRGIDGIMTDNILLLKRVLIEENLW